MTQNEVKDLLQMHFPEDSVSVTDMTGTQDHWEIAISSEKFRGKSLLEQHRLVYQALGNRFEDSIHAVKITTKIP